MSNTAQKTAADTAGVAFVAEFFADLDYDDVGRKVRQALTDGTDTAVGGETLPVDVETICFHSDTPDALALAETVERAARAVD